MNLAAILFETSRPVPLEEIVEQVPGYPPDKVSYRRQFERDKETLRGIGILVSTAPTAGLGSEPGYRVRPEDRYLPELDLSPEERAALQVALTAVRVEGGPATEVLWKLGGLEGAPASSVAALANEPTLPALLDAQRERAPVAFTHRGTRRHLDPWGVVFRRGNWYVVGRDRERDDERAFRLDRIQGDVEVGAPGAFEPPGDLDPSTVLGDEPWRYGDEQPVTARLHVDAPQAPGVVQLVGEGAVEARQTDGSVVVALPVTNVAAFRSFVMGLLDGAEVLGPPELRDAILAWLELGAEAEW